MRPERRVDDTSACGGACPGRCSPSPRPNKTPTGDRQSTYEYDASGNTTKRTIGGNAQNLSWDATGKPTSVKDSAGETTFLYDADGNRVLRKDPKATTVYLPGMELSLAAGSSTVKATRYYSHAGQTVAVRTSDIKLSFLAADHHGTGELAIDAATGAITQRRFDPYGNERGRPPARGPVRRASSEAPQTPPPA